MFSQGLLFTETEEKRSDSSRPVKASKETNHRGRATCEEKAAVGGGGRESREETSWLGPGSPPAPPASARPVKSSRDRGSWAAGADRRARGSGAGSAANSCRRRAPGSAQLTAAVGGRTSRGRPGPSQWPVPLGPTRAGSCRGCGAEPGQTRGGDGGDNPGVCRLRGANPARDRGEVRG